ncbi:MAG: hypothetical protein K9L17_08225 [Clostridiales bacterium]|nr:hypothetical protein [Clostridiales bacterium]
MNTEFLKSGRQEWGYKMRSGKRIEIYLPDDHPVLALPRGQRSQRIREALDLMDRLEKTLTSMDNRLARIEEKLNSGVTLQKREPEENPEQEIEFDYDAFQDL